MQSGNYWQRKGLRRFSRRSALKTAGLGTLGAASLSLVGCGDDDDDDTTPQAGTATPAQTDGTPSPGNTPTQAAASIKRGGMVAYNNSLGFEAVTLDPYRDFSLKSQHPKCLTSSQLYFGVVGGEDPSAFIVEPELAAELPEITDDGLTLIVPLRPGVTWQNMPPVNGRALTVEDVVESAERYRTMPDNPNSSKWADVDAVEAIDDLTVRFRMKRPSAPFLTTLAWWDGYVPQAVEVDPTEDLIGTGPFMLDVRGGAWSPGLKMHFDRNPDYWREGADGDSLPYLEAVELFFLTDASRANAEFLADNLDEISPGAAQQGEFESRGYPSIDIVSIGGLEGWFSHHAFVENEPPFNDPRVRLAFNKAIDDDVALELYYGKGNGQRTWALSPGYGTWVLDPSTDSALAEIVKSDPAEARALLEGAAFDFDTPVTFNITPERYGAVYQSLCEAIAAMWQAVGVQITLRPVPANEWITTVFPGDFEGVMVTLTAPSPDPGGQLAANFASGAERAHSGISIPELDDLIVAANTTYDAEERLPIIKDIQRYAIENVLSLGGFAGAGRSYRQERVQDWGKAQGTTGYYYRSAWVTDA